MTPSQILNWVIRYEARGTIRFTHAKFPASCHVQSSTTLRYTLRMMTPRQRSEALNEARDAIRTMTTRIEDDARRAPNIYKSRIH